MFSIFYLKVFCVGTRDYNSSFKTSLEVVVGVSARSSVILKADLKPGTKYSVYVKATTVKGDGAGSDPVLLYTPSKGMHEKLVFCRCELHSCFSCLVPRSVSAFVSYKRNCNCKLISPCEMLTTYCFQEDKDSSNEVMNSLHIIIHTVHV